MATKLRDRAASNGVPETAPTPPIGVVGGVPRHHLSVAERADLGRSLRTRVARSSHAFWAEAPDRTDPISLLEQQATSRLPDLVPLRYARMRVSPFAFLRGSAVIMAHDLARTPSTGIWAQLCGDCHCANFGFYASPERTMLFDINDFDETLPGPWEWDVKRLAASLVVAGRGNGFSDADCRSAVLAGIKSYRAHMAQSAEMDTLDVWYSRVTVEDLLKMVTSGQRKKQAQQNISKTQQRTSMRAFSKLTEVVDGHRIIANDPPLVMRVTEDQLGVEIRSLFELYLKSLPSARRFVVEHFQVVDVARKVVGVGSVGTRCFIVLLTGRDDNDPLFLQIKEAEASVLSAYLPASIYQHQGERVVVGQELMQSASDIFLGWMTGPGGRHFYWRQLWDMKGSVDVENLSASELAAYSELCYWALARAHARSGDATEIAAYLGASDNFDQAIAGFAAAYADQTERDYQAFLAAIKSGRLTAASTV
ncbi:MAG: DUF2252 domain-containing protein [Ktedonobacterales bacterium]